MPKKCNFQVFILSYVKSNVRSVEQSDVCDVALLTDGSQRPLNDAAFSARFSVSKQVCTPAALRPLDLLAQLKASANV